MPKVSEYVLNQLFVSREKAICELLARHVTDLDQNAESFLVDNLSIPRRYLTEARDIYGNSNESETEVDALA